MDFGDYQQKFMYYQYEFYRRSKAPNERVLAALKEYSIDDNFKKSTEKIIQEHGDIAKSTLKFEYSLFDSYEQKIEKLNNFIEFAKSCFPQILVGVESVGYVIPVDYVRNSALKIKNPVKLFKAWELAIQVYDLNSNGYTKTQISKKLNRYKTSDPQNSLAEVRESLNLAEQLIMSAAKGCFPNLGDDQIVLPC